MCGARLACGRGRRARAAFEPLLTLRLSPPKPCVITDGENHFEDDLKEVDRYGAAELADATRGGRAVRLDLSPCGFNDNTERESCVRFHLSERSLSTPAGGASSWVSLRDALEAVVASNKRTLRFANVSRLRALAGPRPWLTAQFEAPAFHDAGVAGG